MLSYTTGFKKCNNKCSGKCFDYKNGDVVRFTMGKLVVMVDFTCQLDWASAKVLPDEISI